MNYWLNKTLNISQLMKDNRYIKRLKYLTIIQRFFIKMYFRSLVRKWYDENSV